MLWFLLIATSFATLSPTDRWVGNDNLSVGIHQDGSFVNPDLDLGILWDPDGPSGEIPMTGDMLIVGYQWDLWVLESSGHDGLIQGGPHTEDWQAMSWTHRVDNLAVSAVFAELLIDDARINMRTVVLKRADLIIQDIQFVADSERSNLGIGRTFDPDPDWWFLGSYDTLNDSGEGWAVASSLWDDRSVALSGGVLGGPLGLGGICNWCDTIDGMVDSASASGTADRHPNVVVNIDDISASETVTLRFVYAFEIGAENAIIAALDGMNLTDLDDDGLSEDEGDCDDLNPETYPGATEEMDGEDNDCDGDIDEDTLASDDDGDGFSEAEGDCDDTNPDVFPGATPHDGVSNADCDGIEDSPPHDTASPDDTDSPEDTGSPDDTDSPDDSDAADSTEPPDDTPSTNPSDYETSGEVHKGCSHIKPIKHSFWVFIIAMVAVLKRGTYS